MAATGPKSATPVIVRGGGVLKRKLKFFQNYIGPTEAYRKLSSVGSGKSVIISVVHTYIQVDVCISSFEEGMKYT